MPKSKIKITFTIDRDWLVMSDKSWYNHFFDEDYWFLYEDRFNEEKTREDIELLLKLTKVNTHDTILDLACGQGRHTIELAKKGFTMTGFDISESLLEKGKKKAEARGLAIQWLKGDMKQLEFSNEFDLIINMYTSFGFYPTHQENVTVLEKCYEALQPQGMFLMDLWNAYFVVHNFPTTNWYHTKEDILVLEERNYDAKEGRMTTKIMIKDQNKVLKTIEHTMFMYTPAELVRMFKKANFTDVKIFGNLDGAAYSLKKPRVILTARKT